jgi:tetratricopeptide (TPR) repeat protein
MVCYPTLSQKARKDGAPGKEIMTHMTGNRDTRVIEGIKYADDLASKGETELAVQHLLALIEKVPTAASLHGYVAIFLSRTGRLIEAIEHGRQAVQLSPTSEKASFVLFDVLRTSGRHIEALDEMKRFLALRPSEEYTKIIKEWNLNEDDSAIGWVKPT